MGSFDCIDLTRPLDDSLPVFRSENYSDPVFRCTEWCSVSDQGFRVSRLELGTQTGTHIDAPAHFLTDGAPLEALPVDQLMGPYFLIDLPHRCDGQTARELSAAYAKEPILFLRTHPGKTAFLTPDGMETLLALPTPVWVLSGCAAIDQAPEFELNRALARAGKYLIEDLDETAAATVPRGGEMFALPLRLTGTSGAPCRVVARAPSPALDPH